MKTSQSFPFYPSDFIHGTMFMRSEEVGAYMRLLCFQWEHGNIPDDSTKLIKITGLTHKKLDTVLEKFIKDEGGAYINARLERVRSEREAYQKRQSDLGKKGGRPKTNPFETEKPNESQPFSESEAKQKLPSPSPSPLTPIVPNGDEKGTDSKSPYSEDFEDFWTSYPKKIGKGKAYDAWEKAKGKPDTQTILARIETHSKSEQWQKESGQYIPNPATWLNQRRWDDEPDLAPPSLNGRSCL